MTASIRRDAGARPSRALAEVRVSIARFEDDVAHLTDFILSHEGVASVRHDESRRVIVVLYDERVGAGGFLRGALRDRLSATGSPAPPVARPLHVSVAHELRGRLRLRVDGAPPKVVERLAAFVSGLAGVERARASPAAPSIVVHYDPTASSSDAILARVAEAPPGTWPSAPAPAPVAPRTQWLKAGLSAAALAGAVSGALPVPVVAGAVAITAIPPFRRAARSLAEGRVNVDVMDAVAISVCLARSQPVAAAVVTTLLAVGDLILDRTQARARTAISRLMQLDDGDALLLGDGDVPRRVHPRDLRPGDRVVVYPGGRVPADGFLVQGSLSVDEKALTGESVPRDRLPGERVLAASVAVQGQAVVEVERAGGDTVAARIVHVLEGAGAKPMTLQRNVERTADRLVLPAFGAAGAAWALSGAVDRLASVLITDFGTGVRVAVPTAALAAMAMAARAGVLVKGATFLERLHETDTVVFDKTGTLTLGLPEVTAVVPLAGLSPVELAAFAAACESHHAHPIAEALRRHARQVGAPAWEASLGTESYALGMGLRACVRGHVVVVGSARMMRAAGVDPSPSAAAQDAMAARGESSLLVAVDGAIAGVIGYADAPRAESAAVIARLRAGGRRRVMLVSGDARAPVRAIASRLGIDEAIAEVLPEEKADVVRRLKAEGRKVAMVGDGINDAPALAVADVGISLEGGTDVALETADVVLLEGGLARLPAVFDVADQAVARIKQVLGLVLVPNAIGIAAGAAGLLGPVAAAVLNNGSTVAAAMHAVSPLFARRGRLSALTGPGSRRT